jgi:hypothetical protein
MKQIDQTYIYLLSVYIEWKEKKSQTNNADYRSVCDR